MSSKVGAKGNIVIDREIRSRLGVEPGWESVQLLRDGYVEIYFLPPVEPGGSAGCLPPKPGQPRLETLEELQEARSVAAREVLNGKFPDLTRSEGT